MTDININEIGATLKSILDALNLELENLEQEIKKDNA